MLTGDHLSGAGLRVWLEGRLENLPPLRTADNRMEAVLPKTWPATTMLVWPVRGERAGRPIRVNGATAWWAWPPRITQEDAAKPTSVWLMGKNLKVGSAEPRVYVNGPGVAQWISVLAAQPYQLTAQLPAGLRPASITNMRGAPVLSDVKAIWYPFGDQRGAVSMEGALVSRLRLVPSRSQV